jgi:hypothetical protein
LLKSADPIPSRSLFTLPPASSAPTSTSSSAAHSSPPRAEDPTNYKLSTGNLGVVTAILISPTNVLLGLDAPLTNSTFTVKVKNVHDNSCVPNVVATTSAPGIAIGFLEAFQVLCTTGSAFAYGTNGLIKIYSDGDLILSWQPSAIGASLETTSDLTPPATWANVSGSTTNELLNTPEWALSPVLEECAHAAPVRRQSR